MLGAASELSRQSEQLTAEMMIPGYRARRLTQTENGEDEKGQQIRGHARRHGPQLRAPPGQGEGDSGAVGLQPGLAFRSEAECLRYALQVGTHETRVPSLLDREQASTRDGSKQLDVVFRQGQSLARVPCVGAKVREQSIAPLSVSIHTPRYGPARQEVSGRRTQPHRWASPTERTRRLGPSGVACRPGAPRTGAKGRQGVPPTPLKFYSAPRRGSGVFRLRHPASDRIFFALRFALAGSREYSSTEGKPAFPRPRDGSKPAKSCAMKGEPVPQSPSDQSRCPTCRGRA